MKEPKKAEIILEYQNYIETPPLAGTQLRQRATANDEPTINFWRDTWISQIRSNFAKHGPFSARSIGKLFQSERYKPVICAGSGPSLKRNFMELKNRGDICLVSALHNYHLFVDNDIDVDYFVSLDAGPLTIEEVAEGGSKSEDYYWDSTKDKTLLCYIATHPKLLEKWKGEVLFFNCPVPDDAVMQACEDLEPFNVHVGTGGNVLGASMYLAKGILGANPIAFVGADFAFGYDKKFHAWDSKYDKNLGNVVKAIDVFGNKVLSWQSYQNFKSWFEWVAITIPGLYINCTEGGTFGSYPDGNLMAIKQMDLSDFLKMYNMSDHLKQNCENPAHSERVLLF